MGAFDDLIPEPESADSASGAFDDLIPKQEPVRGAFSDLVPERKDPTTYEVFRDDLNRRAGTFNKAVIGVVPSALRLAGAVEHQLGRPLINRTREEYEADLALWRQTNPEDAALSKAGNFITQKLTQMSPPLDEPDVWDNTVQGAGQLTGMLAGGGAIKLAGASLPVVTAGASTMGGIQEFDDAYLRSRERGDDPDTAFAKSLGYATVSTLIENKLGAGRLLRQIIPDPSLLAKKLTALGVSKTVAGNFLAGGAEEGSQRWAQNLIIEGKPSMEGVMDEAIPGAIVQGIAGAPGGVSQRLESDARYRQEQAFDNAIAEHGRKVALEASMPRVGTGENLAVNRPKDASLEVAGAFDDLIPKNPAEPDIWADEDQSPQSQTPVASDVLNTELNNKTSGAVQATSPASGASTPLTISNIQDSTENQTALPPVERMPSDAGFTHSTMARSYFFDGGPGVMISTGYLANAIAGAFPRASSRLWEVFKANEKAITDTLGDIRTLVVTEHWAKLRAEIVTAVESSYGVNTAEARAILDAMLDNPTGVTFRDGARLENRLDALESEQRLAPTPAKTTPSKQSQVRAELMALPGAEQDLDESQLTPEQAAAPATKGDLKQVVEDLRAALQGNQLAPKVDVSSANGGVSGANGKTAQVQPQPAAAMTTGEQSELKTLRQKDADGDLSNEEQQRMRTLWRKETASKRRAATQKYANELKGRGVVIPDGFYNPSEGKENHITDFTVDKNGFIQIRIETHDDASMSSRLVTVKPGDTLSHGMNDTVAGTTRYSESNPLPDQSSSPQGTGTAAGQANPTAGSPVGEQAVSPSPVKQTWEMTLDEFAAEEHAKYKSRTEAGQPYSAIVDLDHRKNIKRKQQELKSVPIEKQLEHFKNNWRSYHRDKVAEAIEDGKAVPQSVLSDYPDLNPPSQNQPSQEASLMDLPTQDKPLDLDATMKAIHEQERNDAARAAQEKQYDAQRKKEQTQGITEADGILHTLTGQGVRLPYFAPGGLVIANYRRLKNKLRGNGILSSDEKQLWNKVREQIPDNFEDQFGVDGDLLKEAYAAAEKAGIASALFVRTDKANLRYDTDVLPKLPREMSVAELLEEVTRLSNQHLANKGKREKGYEGLTEREIAEVKRGEQLAVDQAKVLEDFGNQDEPKTPTAVEQSARTKQDAETLRRIVGSRPGLSELVGLTVVGDGAGTLRPGRGTESGSGGQAATRRFQSKDAAELERLFGVRIILVRRADGIEFNGYFARGEKTILIDADTQHPLLAVAGHELLHHIKQTHPGLYADLVERLSPMVSEAQLESFRNRLSERGQGGLSNAGVTEELIADFIGDNFLRPEFWNDLAKRDPNLFKRLARIVKTWLEKLIAKAKAIRGFESSQHFSDLEQARDVVADVLARFARETQFAARGVPGQEMAAEEAFSKPTTFRASNATVTPPGLVDMGMFSKVAHHGTPHKVDKFSTDKIGTGEGAQVYGWGLYFAENPEVAKNYAETLGNRMEVRGVPVPDRRELMPTHAAVDSVGELEYILGSIKAGSFSYTTHGPILDKALMRLDKALKDYSPGSAAYESVKKVGDWWDSIGPINAINQHDVKYGRGREYTVSLAVEDEDLLDWDKPLSEQSEKVNKAFASALEGSRWEKSEWPQTDYKLVDKHGNFILSRPAQRETNIGNLDGATLYRVVTSADTAKAASEYLASLGIKGIRYLDQGSRVASNAELNDLKAKLAHSLQKVEQWQASNQDTELKARQIAMHEADAKHFQTLVDNATKPTYNYVIFSGDDITITHENGKEVTAHGMFSKPSRSDFSFDAPESVAKKADMPSRFALRKPILGQGGTAIVGYEWRSRMGEKWSNREGGLVDARVSDWDNADESTGTGRAIVHVFYVRHADGSIKPEGIRSAQNVLGFNEARLMTIAKKERAAQEYAAEQERLDVAAYDKIAADTPAEAARINRKNNYSPMRSFEDNDALFDETALFEKGGKYVRRNEKTAERMERFGWSRVVPDPAKAARLVLSQPESVEDQKTRLAAEKRKADAKTVMQERAGAKLTGSDLDTTQEMFGQEVKQDKDGQLGMFSKPEQTNTPEFKRWFGDSKVVDAEGEPMVVYHGTKSVFSVFSRNKAGASDAGLVGKAFYFTPSGEQAGDFAVNKFYGRGDSPNVLPVFVKLENPYIITDGKLPDGRSLTDVHPNGISARTGSKLQNEILMAGHDGVLFKHGSGELAQVVAFYPRQIKSATGNRGTFNPDEADIRFSKPTGIKNAAMEDELADVGKLGLPGFLRTERKSNQTLHDTVTARIADEPGWIDTIIEREKKQPSSLTDEEVFALSHRLVELSSAHSKASRKAAAANDAGDMDTVVESGAQANDLSDKIKELADITKESGTIAGRALQARARLFAEDFSLVAMEAKKREANDWAPLTAEQRADIQKQHDAYEAKIAELEQHLEETTGQLIDEELRRAKAEEEAAALPRYDARVIHHAEQFALAWHKVRLKEEADLMAMLKDSETGGMFSKPSIGDRVTKLARYIVEDIVRGVKKAEILNQLKNKFGASVEAKFEAIWTEANNQMERSLSKADKAVPDIADKIKRVIKRKDAAEREAEARGQIETMIAKGEAGTIFGAVQKMIRSIVEQNRKITREGLIDEVHNTLKEFMPDITRLEAMDAISGRGRFTLPSSDEVSTIVRDLKAQTRLVGHQMDVQAKRPLPRTGFQPGQQSDAVRREAKILEELKRRFGVVVSDPTKQLASVLTARKTYYRNRLADMAHEIKTRELTVKTKSPEATDTELEALKAEYKALRAEHDSIFTKPGLTDAQRLELSEKAADRHIAELERQLRTGEIFAPGKKPAGPTSAALEAKKARIEALKAEREWARDLLQPKPEIDRVAQALKQRQASLTRQIADYADRLARGDFAKRTRKVLDITQDTKAMALMAQRDAIKKRFEKGVFDDRMARRTRMQKIFYGIRQSKDAMVNIMSSGDLSAPRQLFNYFLDASTRLATSPRAGLEMFKQPLGKMFQAAWSEEKAGAIEQWRLNQPNAKSGAYKIMGIEFSDLHAQSFSKQEEFAHSILDDWAALPFKTGNAAKSAITAPGKAGARMVRVSNRAFISALNVARVMLANELMKANFSHRAPTDAELRAIGNLVNLSTGRGAMNTKVASVTSNVLWSPKLAASRLQVLIGQPLWGKAGREGGGTARKMVLQWYVRQLVAASLLATIVRMFKWDDDDELSSSDAGKVKRGRTRIDPWMGYAQFVVLADRLIESETTSTTTGKTRKLAGGGNLEVIGRFLANKTRPDIVAIVKASAYAFDKARGEEKPRFTGTEVVQSAIPAPLALQEVIAIMRENGMAEGAIIQVLAQFGVGVSVYEDREKQK